MSAMDTQSSDRRFMVANAIVSALALTLLAWLLVLRGHSDNTGQLGFMPAVNATLNGAAACLLLAGYRAIKTKNRSLHKRLMVSAFCASTLFLVGYLVYHYVHGDTKFLGQGPIRLVYFSILASHVLLSIAVVPLALAAFYFAYQQRFNTHAKVARVLFPIWLYVSVTGVAIFFLLRSHS